MRVLYLHPGPVPPPKDPLKDEFHYVPEPVSGDILLPVWSREPREILDAVGPHAWPEHRVGNFTYRFLLAGHKPAGNMRRRLRTFQFYLREGLRLSRRRKYDCILTYGWTLTGAAGLLLARLTGSRLIVTIPNIPENAYRYNRFGSAFEAPRRDPLTRAMRAVSDFALRFMARRADCVRLFYPWQLDAYPGLANVPAYVLHGFVPVSRIPATGVSDGSVLLIGAPWYVKGVDLLMRAFRAIESEFPEARLRIMGHYPGADFRQLIGDSRQIEVLAARRHSEAMEVLADCSVYVLASRTEAMGRVLLEAMAAGKPVVAARVGGIPYYVRDGINGLLFARENVEELAAQLRKLLRSPELQRRLGENGQRLVRTECEEAVYGGRFREMVALTAAGKLRTAGELAAAFRAESA